MRNRGSIVGGIIMILLGTLFLLIQLFPEMAAQLDIGRSWPLIIVAVGSFFLLGALLGTPPLAVPGSIIAGIGGILYYQNLTGNWGSWAFAWALIPGFVGVGLMVSGLLGGKKRRQMMREGSRLVVISLVLFAAFWTFFQGLGNLGRFWPILLILLGAWLLLQRR